MVNLGGMSLLKTRLGVGLSTVRLKNLLHMLAVEAWGGRGLPRHRVDIEGRQLLVCCCLAFDHCCLRPGRVLHEQGDDREATLALLLIQLLPVHIMLRCP